MSKNPLLHTLIAMTGQDNVITVHRPFVEFTGSLEAAMMLSQLLYWTPRSSMGGWVAKSDKEWNDELCLTRYSIRTATTTLEDMEIIETKLKKFNGAPTKHYLVKWDVLESTWTVWLEKQNRLSEIEQSDCAKADNSQSEIRQSLTETTTENTTETTTEIKNTAAAVSSFMQNAGYSQAQSILEQGAGMLLTGDLVSKIDTVYQLIQTYGEKETLAALQVSLSEWKKNKRKDNGRNYSVLNPAWVDWAVAHLAGETPWSNVASSNSNGRKPAAYEPQTIDDGGDLPTWEEFSALPGEVLARVIQGTCSECGGAGDVIKVKDGALCLGDFREWRIDNLGLERRYAALGGVVA